MYDISMTFTNDDGNEEEYSLLKVIDVDEAHYAVFHPVDEEKMTELRYLRFDTDALETAQDLHDVFLTIEDDAEYHKVFEKFWAEFAAELSECAREESDDLRLAGLILEDSDGNEMRYGVWGTTEMDNCYYAALVQKENEDDDDEELPIFEVYRDEDGKEVFSQIFDDDLYDAVYTKLLEDEEMRYE